MAKKPVQLDAKGYPKFGMRDKIAYAAGDFGCNMSFSLKGTVQTFWLVYMMLETGLLSGLLLLVQIWDAVNDPMIGSMIDADRRQYKRGKFKQYIFIGSCGLLVAGAAVFLPFPNAPVVIKAMLFILGYVIWDAAYTVANVPYGSMLSLVTEDAGERAQLSTWRSVGSMVGNMAPMAILPMLIWHKEVDANGNPVINPETGVQVQTLLGDRVFWVALLMGVLGFIAFQFMLKAITIRVDENTIKAGESGEKFNVLNAFGNFMKNRPAVGATLAAMGMFLGMNAATTAVTIMFATYFGMAQLSGIVQIIGFLPMFLFMPFIKKIVDKFGKKEASVAGTIASLFGGVVMLIFPMIGDKSVALIVYLVGLVIFGLGMGIYTCVSWALMADAIDYSEWKFGKKEASVAGTIASLFGGVVMLIFPMIGDKSVALIVYLVGLVIFGLGMGIYTCVSWALMADAIDYNEWKTGKREEGTVYSLHSFFRKLAQGVGPSVVLLIMGALGYVSELGTGGQSAATSYNMCWLVAGLYLFSAVMQFIGLAVIYNLDKKTMAKMNSELAERRAANK